MSSNYFRYLYLDSEQKEEAIGFITLWDFFLIVPMHGK